MVALYYHVNVWSAFFILVIYAIVLRCSATSTDDLGRAIVAAVNDALAAAHIDTKTIADRWSCSVARVHQVLSNDPTAPVTLIKLLKLPFPFWLHFSGWLFALIAQQRIREVAELVGEVRRGA